MTQDVYLTVRINDKCQPIDRGDIYEDPLSDVLEERKLGEVTGGGSQLNDKNQIEYCELEVCVFGNLTEEKRTITETLESIGLPKGSTIILDNEETLIGNHEVMAIHFDNLNLPSWVYEENDINDVLADIEMLLGEHCRRNSYTASNKETIVFYGGPSFETMKNMIMEYVNNQPLCKNGKVTQAV